MKKFFINILILTAVFSTSLLTADFLQSRIQDEFAESITEENSDLQSYKYKISVFNGKLALFEGSSKIPYKVYDTYVNTLPEEDLKLLTEGIKVKTSSELIKIIEEYTS